MKHYFKIYHPIYNCLREVWNQVVYWAEEFNNGDFYMTEVVQLKNDLEPKKDFLSNSEWVHTKLKHLNEYLFERGILKENAAQKTLHVAEPDIKSVFYA